MEKIPNTLKNLHNLRTLNISEIWRLEEIPDFIWNMNSLERVIIDKDQFKKISRCSVPACRD